MSSNNQSNNIVIDEFGRDLSLKQKKTATSNTSLSRSRFKGMSWADICDFIEEEAEKNKQEEEERNRREELEKFRTILEERKLLVQKGEYQLEDGEELDL